MKKHLDDTSNGASKYGTVSPRAASAHGAEGLALVNGSLLAETIISVLRVGDAILFGVTRDGGAVVMQIFNDGAADKLYGSTPDELEKLLRGVLEVATG